MGALTDETNTLKLYTSLDDEIWYVAGSGMPKPSSYSYSEFCSKIRLANKKSVVRLVGSFKNSKLIRSLYLHKQAGDISGLQVCSPQVETVNIDEYSPEKILMNMRRWKYPSSLGGFHEVDAHDFIVYSMAHLLNSEKPSKQLTEKILILYKTHPLHKVLSFVPFFNQELCAKILAITLDPRWYVDMSNPERLNKYYMWMGLGWIKTPSDDAIVPGVDFAGSKADRRKIVVGAWQNNLTRDVNWKNNFLAVTYGKGRKIFNDKRKNSDSSFDEADLATSHKFLSFVNLAWMNLLYPMPNPWMEPLFVPDLFFSSEEESSRYKKFMAGNE